MTAYASGMAPLSSARIDAPGVSTCITKTSAQQAFANRTACPKARAEIDEKSVGYRMRRICFIARAQASGLR